MMEEDSQTSDEFLEEKSDGLEMEEHDLDIDGNDLVIESNGLDLEENCLEISGNDLDNDCEQMLEIEENQYESKQVDMIEASGVNGISQEKEYPPPALGMEFNSYDDAYNYYNSYAGDVGFGIRVKSSWTKRNSKEKRGAVLCCNCEGFKTIKEASSRRKETRTGCLAMLRLRLVDSGRWRVDEVKLEHNHEFDPERAQNSKSHKKLDIGFKRKVVEPAVDVEVRTIKLYRTHQVDAGSNSIVRDIFPYVDRSKCLNLREGDTQIVSNFFGCIQLTNPNFIYLMDLNDEGRLRNVFWMDSSSRAAYTYFGDVVSVDTTCLSDKYEIPLVAFLGINHHGRSILLGCAFLGDETLETYIWLFRAWLTCMSGRPPQTLITGQNKDMQTAISEVFPRAHHRWHSANILRSIAETLGEFEGSCLFQMVLERTVYYSLKVDEFEIAWGNMLHRFGLRDHTWLHSIYEERERWVPVYLKDTLFAGCNSRKGESLSSFFDGFLHKETTLKEFFDVYESIPQKKSEKEAIDDIESRDSTPMLKTGCYYELQLSKLYTNEIFRRFQDEVAAMSLCFSVNQVNINGPMITYVVKEREGEGDAMIRSFEVIYDKVGAEVRCTCGSFNFQGYLCRHALCILNFNGVEEVPFQNILSRWRKDFKRLYSVDSRSNVIDIANPVQRFEHLYRRSMQVVEEGMISQEHYMVAWQAFKESLNKVRLVADKHHV